MTTKEFQERSDLRIFLSYFKPHKKLFVLDMVCALTIALIDLAFPYLSRWCMYELLPQNAYRTFFTVMAVAAAAFAVRGVLTYIIGYYGHTVWYSGRGGHPPGSVPPHAGTGFRLL